MFENELLPVISALKTAFGDVKELYSEINLPERRNEIICFGGVSSYGIRPEASDGSGGTLDGYDAVYLVELLGKRSSGAAYLENLLDQKAVPALSLCLGKIIEIRRLPTKYSKEQGGFISSCELHFSSYESGTRPPESIGFSVDGISYPCMTEYEVINRIKTAETPLINGTIKTRIVGERPAVLKIKGKLSLGGSEVFAALKTGLGKQAGSLIIDRADYSGMTLVTADLKTTADGVSEINLEYAEVNDQ